VGPGGVGHIGNPTPDIGYDSAGLRQAARQHSDVQTRCTDMSRTLTRAVVAAGAFGRVDAAAGFHTVLEQARTGQSQGCDAEPSGGPSCPQGGANEVAVGERTANGGQQRLDSYIPGEEIVSRKHTQLAEVNPSTAEEYLAEIDRKYAPGTPIADTPGNREKLGEAEIGRGLDGRKILEVPVQNGPIPQDILDDAARRNIRIRDEQGRVLG
jgi:hypothetical protein